ncbi:MAG: DUF2189 domain-containing protein [Bdellovibrio bacteriovorus]
MSAPTAVPYRLRDLRNALGVGWRVLSVKPGPSLILGVLLALTGTALWLALAYQGATPLGWVLTGGFLLIGPALLAGFFGLYRRWERGERLQVGDAFLGFTEAGGGFWAVAGFCAFLFLVWLTDAGVLYAFQVGASPLMEGASGPWDWSSLSAGARTFALWASPVGAFLALGLYLVTAFSVPLLYERRSGVIPAVVASIRAVLGNLGPALAWALIICLGIVPGILIPLVLPITLPVLAYGSFALYRRVFPLDAESEANVGRASARPTGPREIGEPWGP